MIFSGTQPKLQTSARLVLTLWYRLRQLGYNAATAAVHGCRQIAGAITASTLTTVCVFAVSYTHLESVKRLGVDADDIGIGRIAPVAGFQPEADPAAVKRGRDLYICLLYTYPCFLHRLSRIPPKSHRLAKIMR